jgi:hypothetical protein
MNTIKITFKDLYSSSCKCVPREKEYSRNLSRHEMVLLPCILGFSISAEQAQRSRDAGAVIVLTF